MREADFQRRVIDYALLHHWRIHHTRPARTQHGWRTPLEGHPGLPDLVLARNGVVLLVELKSERGRPTRDQEAWLAAAGPHARLWYPKDWATIVTELAA